jgi:peptidoglycan/LPS O-acetylase OafA/YrhL
MDASGELTFSDPPAHDWSGAVFQEQSGGMATTLTARLPIPSNIERQPVAAPPVRPHLAFLDGMRGLTAFYVLLHHVYTHIMSHEPPQLYGVGAYFAQWLSNGTLGVSIFIVLSGYCLMLPAAYNRSKSLSCRRFLRRRATRILPPYYAALALSLVFIATTPLMQPHTHSPWDHAVPAFLPGRLVSHLLLVHNAQEDWLWAIDPPMWSIAVEWQTYFIFILLLYPAWRRIGIIPTVIVAFAIGLAPPALGGSSLALGHPWYVGLFALGMLGAVATYSITSSRDALMIRLPTVGECGWAWGLLAMMAVLTPFGNDLLAGDVSADALLGILTMATIVAMARETQLHDTVRRSPLTRFLESRLLVWLGAFSYSLYLVHFPIVSFCDRVLSPLVHSYRFPIAMFAVCVPLCLVVAYVFHLAFERPFMSRG